MPDIKAAKQPRFALIGWLQGEPTLKLPELEPSVLAKKNRKAKEN